MGCEEWNGGTVQYDIMFVAATMPIRNHVYVYPVYYDATQKSNFLRQ